MHEILTDHRPKLRKEVAAGIKKLKTEIYSKLREARNVTVIIHLDDLDPISVVDGKGENILVIHIDGEGEITHEWNETTMLQKMRFAIQDVVSSKVFSFVKHLFAVAVPLLAIAF